MESAQLERLLNRLVWASRRHHAALESLDEETANRQADVIARIAAGILAGGEAGEEGLAALTRNPDPVVAGMAAVYLLPRKPEEALMALRRVAREAGLIGFRARCAIDRWEKGEWG